jgi:hypothetical protein
MLKQQLIKQQANKSSASEGKNKQEHRASADDTVRRFFYERSVGLCALANS